MQQSHAKTSPVFPKDSAPIPRRGEMDAPGVGPRGYLLQLLALGMFFGVGLVLTLRYEIWNRLLGRSSTPAAERRRLRSMFHFFTGWLERRGGFRFEFIGMEELRDLRGTIVAANHPGLMDVVALISRLPEVSCIMRAGLMRNPSFHGMANLAGFITNDSGPAFLRGGQKKLRAGENLLIFPEGTRTREGVAVNPFKKGFALLAARTGAPVQTVIIRLHGSFLRKGISLLRPAARLPIPVEVRAGARFVCGKDESAADFARRLERYFQENLS